ncbi:hypothetical protein ABFT23_10020 [Nocardioides sp. C4-1]|uniref:hypothetical protein n=1 Tax=Nocardioides sp. C4-1 TaxID=3151851 RepID=UPI0032643F97
MLRRLASATALVVVPVLALSVVPAHAGSWSAPDPVGDAATISYDPEPQPCGTLVEVPSREGDLRRVSVRHTADRVLVRLDVTGLVAARRTTAEITVATPSKAYSVTITKPRRRVVVDLTPFPAIDEDDVNECGSYFYGSAVRSCRGSSGSIQTARDRITLSLPRRCLGGIPRWVQVGAYTYAGAGEDMTFDQWVPRGWDGDYLAPIVGRKVFAPR